MSANMYNAGETLPELEDRIVKELLIPQNLLTDREYTPVTNEDILKFSENLRPQLTGTLYKKDTSGNSYGMLLTMYTKWKETGDMGFYHRFRQGLDILDLDPITYEIIGMNPNSMGYWYPKLMNTVSEDSFFKVPGTKIVKVPLPVLQLTRLDYFSLTPTTLNIVDEWVKEVFELDENRTYFIKTGTYSSKFDFRNAKVTSPSEVNEIGRYLLFIHAQALAMAHYDLSGHNQPCIYGVSTTNEWVVREYIEDAENLPCICHGMPLHTEFRAFIDFDTDTLLGIVPYWDAEKMKECFTNGDDADTADMKHDYIIFCKEEERLKREFEENRGKVAENLERIIPDINLTGQWSLDIMKNGKDFYLIDMAVAQNSALKDRLPVTLKKYEEDWLPDLSGEHNNKD